MFLFMGREAHSRSLAKPISCLVNGSIDAILQSWLFTCAAKLAGAITTTEVLTKMILCYFHEKAWSSVPWALRNNEAAGHAELREHLAL